MLRFALSLTLVFLSISCKTTSTSKVKDIADIVGVEDHGDGTFTVTCANGRKEKITQEDYNSNNVCKSMTPTCKNDEKIVGFECIAQCRNGDVLVSPGLTRNSSTAAYSQQTPAGPCKDVTAAKVETCQSGGSWSTPVNPPNYPYDSCSNGCLRNGTWHAHGTTSAEATTTTESCSKTRDLKSSGIATSCGDALTRCSEKLKKACGNFASPPVADGKCLLAGDEVAKPRIREQFCTAVCLEVTTCTVNGSKTITCNNGNWN